MGDNSNFVFRQELVGEDGSVRRGVIMVKQPGVLDKFGGDVFTLFHAVSAKLCSRTRIHSSACWGKFFVHKPLDVEESDDHALEIAFHLSGLFLALVTWGFSTGRIVALFQGRNRKPSYHHQ